MRRTIVLALVLLLTACAPPRAPPPAPPFPAAPPLAVVMPPPPAGVNQTGVGPVLVTAQGMTLYAFAHDTPGVSKCNGPCAVHWPPFRAPPGARGFGPWSVIRRADGTRQWAYRGVPLYTWFKDKAPGQTSGEGVGKVWHVARP